MEADRDAIRVVHVGLGQIGAAIARLTGDRPGLRSVAAVDPNPSYAGKTLAEVWDGGADIHVRSSLEEALADAAASNARPQVAFHAVASDVPRIEPQLVELARAGLNVVTTAEELIHPYDRYPEQAAHLDAVAKECGVTIFAAGVNPGFLMDRLPAYLSGLCVRVDGVRISRLVDLGRRRPALRRKMGVGETESAVTERIEQGSIGHVGLIESLQYLGHSLGWRLGDIVERLAPVVASERLVKAGETVEAGCVLGLQHTAEAAGEDGRTIALALVMRLDADEPVDEVRIDGEPPIELKFVGGVAGDQATAATVLNAARYVVEAGPGLIARIPVPTGF